MHTLPATLPLSTRRWASDSAVSGYIFSTTGSIMTVLTRLADILVIGAVRT